MPLFMLHKIPNHLSNLSREAWTFSRLPSPNLGLIDPALQKKNHVFNEENLTTLQMLIDIFERFLVSK